MGAGKFTARSEGGGQDSVEEELTKRIRELPVGVLPDSRFVGELRSQLVSIAPRIIAESADAPLPSSLRSPARTGFLAKIRRPLIALTGAAAVLVLLLGLAVWVSNGALPGQSLYGVKRASENFQLSISGSDTSRGKAYLQQATSRAKEAGKLVGEGDQPSAHTSSLISSALTTADADTRGGMQALGRAAVSQRSADPLSSIASWASAQRDRLTDLQTQLPAGPARTKSQTSLVLVQRVAARAALLKTEVGCGCLSASHTDDLGPVPCTNCVSKTPGLPTLPTGLPSVSSPPSGGPSLPGLGGSPSATGS